MEFIRKYVIEKNFSLVTDRLKGICPIASFIYVISISYLM